MKISKNRLYFHIPYYKLLKNLEFIGEQGINPEVYVGARAIDERTPQERERIEAAFRKYGLERIVHGPFADLNPGSPDPRARQLACQRYREAIEFCHQIGSRLVVFHSGFHPVYHRHYKERWLQNSLNTWLPLVSKARELGITIALENSIDTSPEVIVWLIERIDSDFFKACFDIAHYYVFAQTPILQCLKDYPPGSIIEVHLSDNNGQADDHLALGKGSIDFEQFFRALDEKNIIPLITIEPHSREGISISLDYLRRWMPSCAKDSEGYPP